MLHSTPYPTDVVSECQRSGSAGLFCVRHFQSTLDAPILSPPPLTSAGCFSRVSLYRAHVRYPGSSMASPQVPKSRGLS